MEEANQKKISSGGSTNYFSWAASVMLGVAALAMLYVSVALFYPPIQNEAVIFAALSASPPFILVEWFMATLVGLYAAYSVRKRSLPGLGTAILFALAYVHLHWTLLGNISIAAWLSVLAAISALIGVLVAKEMAAEPG